MRFVRKLVVVAVFVAVLVGGWQFAAQNSTPIQIHYLAGALDGVALWAALIGAFVVGGWLMAALGSYQVLRARMMTRRYRKLVAGLEAEVHQLRNLPLSMDDPVAPEDEPGNAAPMERRA